MKSIFVGTLLIVSSNVFAANPVMTVKVELKNASSSAPFTQMGTGFLVDDQSANTSEAHACNNRKTYVVTANDLFKKDAVGETADLTFQFGPYPGDENIFEKAKAQLVGRDYFSGAAILELGNADSLESAMSKYGYAMTCVGLNGAGGTAAYAQGYTYYSLKNQLYQLGQLDKGLVGGLTMDNGRTKATGYITRNYFANPQNKAEGLEQSSFADLKNYLIRILRGQTQSSKGVLNYFQKDETFVYKGSKDAFAMVAEPASANGKVRILGAPEEVIRSSDVAEFSRMSRGNAFSGLQTLVGAGSSFFLKSVNGRDASTWQSMVAVMTQVPERFNPIVEFEVRSASGRTMNFMAGDRFVEYLSLIRFISQENSAIFDDKVSGGKDQPGRTRNLNENERRALESIRANTERIYSILASHPLDVLASAGDKERSDVMNQLTTEVKAIIPHLFTDNGGIGKFSQDSKTLFAIQQWILELDKKVNIERSKLTRATLQRKED